MGMTLTEKILANRAGKQEVKPGDLIFAKIDIAMATDISSPLTIKVFEEMGGERVFDADKVPLVHDHLTPAKDIKSAEFSKMMRNFARDQGIKYYYEVGRSGISHQLLPEQGLIHPGDVVFGADSHSTTYGALGCFATGVGSTDMAAAWVLGESWLRVPESIKISFSGKLDEWVSAKDMMLLVCRDLGLEGGTYRALEFGGPTIESMPMYDRFVFANMTIECGGKNGVVQADDATRDYLTNRAKKPEEEWMFFEPDPDAQYWQELSYDVTDLQPMVAQPHLPGNVVPVTEAEPVPVDQVYIGSCTNGKIEDLRIAARVLEGRKVNDRLRMVVVPATEQIYHEMLTEGLAEVFHEAGASIGPPTCGACFGAHMGVMAENEVGVFTTNRNFVGRNGHTSAQVYLVSPAVAAATAIRGTITDPREIMN
ncbi:3-isopropylmalate dehydratase large subunit [bacterium]|nr:3-isopropylmalate dehydratase large subunit [bacterium]